VISFNKDILELSHGDSRARASSSYLTLVWSQARWITFGSSRLGDGALQEDFGTLSSLWFRSIVKD